MPEEMNDLIRFYEQQYGMIFHITYNAMNFYIKGEINFRKVKKYFSIDCIGRSEKEITGIFHTVIYDVLLDEKIDKENRK